MFHTLTFEEKYRIIGKQDSSFEGVFITAVKSTGIFCRPSCRARKPNPENVIFYSTVAEAIQNGYRACKICTPLDKIDVTPAYIQLLIDELTINPQINISDKDLLKRKMHPQKTRRWFKSNYGITFHSYQRMIRIYDAYKNLQNGTSVTDSAFQSGYNSLSGFNQRFLAVFGQSPTKIKNPVIIVYSKISTPIGSMIACTTKKGLCLLEFDNRKNLELQFKDLKENYNAILLPGKSKHIDQTKIQLLEYFNGARTSFDLSLDLLGSSFRKTVWNSLIEIPYGTTITYKQQSINIGKPNAVRAVASANAANKIAIIVPCHRVIGSNGSMKGYAAGINRKKWLLHHEGYLAKNGSQLELKL